MPEILTAQIICFFYLNFHAVDKNWKSTFWHNLFYIYFEG